MLKVEIGVTSFKLIIITWSIKQPREEIRGQQKVTVIEFCFPQRKKIKKNEC
jgi:hypothetical protein